MYIHARVKGQEGTISLPTVPLRSRDKEMQTQQLKKVDEEAREQYKALHPATVTGRITVDIKISRTRNQ